MSEERWMNDTRRRLLQAAGGPDLIGDLSRHMRNPEL